MIRISKVSIFFIGMVSLSIVGVIVVIGMMDERDTKIKQLQNKVNNQEKLLQMMNVENQKDYNDTTSIFDAIRYAEQDNYTMANQISPHCFYKITGKDSSKVNCYGSNIVDERINACMFQHNVVSITETSSSLPETANRDSCTKMMGGNP
jgi:hypothetical protein